MFNAVRHLIDCHFFFICENKVSGSSVNFNLMLHVLRFIQYVIMLQVPVASPSQMIYHCIKWLFLNIMSLSWGLSTCTYCKSDFKSCLRRHMIMIHDVLLYPYKKDLKVLQNCKMLLMWQCCCATLTLLRHKSLQTFWWKCSITEVSQMTSSWHHWRYLVSILNPRSLNTENYQACRTC